MPVMASMRTFISLAALLVKVTARTWWGVQPLFQHQVGDLVGDDPRLARAGAGDDEQGRIEMQDRVPLLGVEAGQDVSGHCRRGSWARTGRE